MLKFNIQVDVLASAFNNLNTSYVKVQSKATKWGGLTLFI